MILEANLIPPTAQNQGVIEEDLREVAKAALDLEEDALQARYEQSIRNHDPCISCAAHFPQAASAPGMSGSNRPPVLVIGIGYPDRADDGVGPAVGRRLRGRLPPGVSVLERGGDILALTEDWEGFSAVILVDAVAPITTPGRIDRLDLAKNPLPVAFSPGSSHAFGLAETVELARSLGRLPPFHVAYLIEGEQFGAGGPLSPPVATAVERAVEQITLELSAIEETPRGQGTARHA